MKIIKKIARSQEEIKAYQYVITHLNRGKINKNTSGDALKDYIELHFEDLLGDAYIQISFDEFKMPNNIRIEIYYDSENAQDEYGMVEYIPLNISQPQETINKINQIVDVLIGKRVT